MDDSLLNFSRVDTDPFAGVPEAINITEPTFSQPSRLHIVWSYAFLVAELANFFLGIAAVISDVLLIYFIFRYKRLRKSLNLYIANYAIMNLCYYLIAPILLIIHVMFSSGYSYFYHLFCYITMIENTCQISSFFIVMMMGWEWTMSIVNPGFISKIAPIFKYKYLIIYMWILLFLILCGVGCLYQIRHLQSLPFYVMPFIVLSLIYMHFVRSRRILNEEHLKTEYTLWVCTMAIGCFVPIYILDLMLYILSDYLHTTVIMFIYLFEYILSFLWTPSPVFILYYIIKWNKYFKMAFDTTFKKAVRNYGADNLDDASDNEEIIQDGGQKNVESDSNGLNRAEIMVL